MFKVFKKRKVENSPGISILKQIGVSIDRRLKIFANYLGHQSEKLSLKTKNCMLILYCLFFGGGCFFMIFSAFNNTSNAIGIEKVTIPNHVIHEDAGSLSQPAPALSDKVIKNIQRFKNYMDSLQQTSSGKVKYDSIIRARPGLMDSLFLTESLYKQKDKK